MKIILQGSSKYYCVSASLFFLMCYSTSEKEDYFFAEKYEVCSHSHFWDRFARLDWLAVFEYVKSTAR